ncbi:NAD(P)-binding protein [Trichoderma sp. SZMC 28013]
MAVIRNVAVAGASGNIGSYVLKALLQANFNVTVLTRSQKPGAYDSKITVVEVDFTSVSSLTSALQNQDAIVSTVGKDGLEAQKLLIDAAIAAGVQRFIPSDYGVCTTSPKVLGFPFYSTLATVRQYLEDKAATGALSYTVVAIGSFLEYVLMTPAVVNFKEHSVTLMDEGKNRISTSPLASIGTAIAGVFKNPDETKNRVVYVSATILTQKQIFDIAKEIKPEITWTVSNTKASDILKQGLDAVASGDGGLQAVGNILIGTAFGGDEYGCAYDNNDNALLGIETITHEKIKSLIAQHLN